MKRSTPILLYHHVSPDREITPIGFERQMRFLLDQGYQSLSLDDLLMRMEGRAPMTPRGFVVTFDDGYLDNWIHAFPVLKKLGVKATIYVVTSFVERHAAPRTAGSALDTRTNERGPGGFLSWAEARVMSASGLVAFGSHTHTHRAWARRKPYENLEAEMAQSKALLESELGQPCRHMAWPWGDYEKAWWPLLERLGYRSAATTRSGANTVGTHPFALQRMTISRESPEWLNARLRWHAAAAAAQGFGFFYAWDRRFKKWARSESPYSHG